MQPKHDYGCVSPYHFGINQGLIVGAGGGGDGPGRDGGVLRRLRTGHEASTREVHTTQSCVLIGVFHHTPALIRRAVGLLAEGAFDPMPLVTHEVDLTGHPLAMMARGEAFKVLMLVHPPMIDAR